MLMTETRDEQGKWLTRPEGSAPLITSATARTMALKRWENFRRNSNKRIVAEAASIDPAVSSPADAYGLLMAKQFTALMDSDKPVVDQAEKLGKFMAGVTGENSQRENAPAGQISGDPGALLELLQAIERNKQAAVDQARAVDTTATDTRNEIQGK